MDSLICFFFKYIYIFFLILWFYMNLLNDFFPSKTILFVACVPWIFFLCVCFWSTKKMWGTQTNYNQFRSPKICFSFIKNTKKNKIQGTQATKKIK